ncbi:MAG: epoxyqueuosine reductase QueH [Hominimerdicola sp.]
MQKINYQKQLDKIIESIEKSGATPTLLLHSCCAPCSSYVLEYLSKYFRITVFYYNPNIYPEEEFLKRCDEQKRLISQMPVGNKVEFLEIGYDDKEFYNAVRGVEHIKEGGERCFR